MTDPRNTHCTPRTASRRRGGRTGALVFAALLGAAAMPAAGCIDRPIAPVLPNTQSAVTLEVDNRALSKVDLLLMVDNSNSMLQNQANIAAQLDPLIGQLTNPPDRDGDGMPDYPAVRDLHVAVIDSDLGAGGYPVPTCNRSPAGDDGRLNPLHNGPALRAHAADAPLPAECGAAGAEPDILTFDSQTSRVADFSRQFRCSALLGTGGCGLEQQLDSTYRALITNGARSPSTSSDPNAGFLRDDALLAIVLLTDEEDGSTRPDAQTVYDDGSRAWSDFDATHTEASLNLRFYLYQPGGPQDPTYPLDRYINPHDAAAGFLGLKPGHPERVIFAAITSVPLELPTVRDATGQPRTNWDALLGRPTNGDPDDFVHRDTSTALSGSTADGAFNLSPVRGPNRDFPIAACTRHEGTTLYSAYPARRIVEVARRFDEAPLCDRAPCRNGLVTSICSTDYTAAVRQIVDRIAARLPPSCLPRVLQQQTDGATGARTVDCVARETQPPGASCDATRGRTPALDNAGNPLIVRDADGTEHTVCEVAQIPIGADNLPVSTDRPGWYYEPVTTDPSCRQRISFTPQGEPGPDASMHLECIQSVVRANNSGATGT